MLRHLSNPCARSFSLENISPDGMKTDLVPKPAIRDTHDTIAIVLCGGILSLNAIHTDLERIVLNLRSCAVTATAYADGMIGVHLNLFSSSSLDALPVYFEYDIQAAQRPRYLIKSNKPNELKPYCELTWRQRVAKLLWPWAYPRVTA